MTNKKAQEEIVGFVIVVVIVAVVFLILLGIFLRSDINESVESREVYQFLESLMEYTTECEIGENNIDIEDLIQECYEGESCNGKDSCEVLNSSLISILEVSWPIGDNRPFKGYIFKANYETNATSKSIIEIKRGDCSQNAIGAEIISQAFPGSIITSLEICS